MIKPNGWAQIDVQVQATLDQIHVDQRSKRWESESPKAVAIFKEEVKSQGLALQDNRCVWCTLTIGLEWSRTPHRDHIAPKSIYGQWTFLPQNIAMACECCNGLSKKKDTDTIESYHADYTQAVFSVVHPYFDAPDDHIAYVDSQLKLPVAVQNKTEKGRKTIELFALDSPLATQARASEHLLKQHLASLSPVEVQLVSQALGYSSH